MVRTFDVTIDGLQFKLASMSWVQAETHVAEGRELLKKREQGADSNDEWTARTIGTVADSINRASTNGKVDSSTLKTEYDMPTINALYQKVLEISGLKPAGEVAAVSVSPSSGAA